MRPDEISFFSIRYFAEFILRFRYLVLIASVLIVVVCAMGLPKIKVTADYRVMFSDDYPQPIAFDAMQNIFGQRDNIMIVLAPENGNVFSRETLEAVECLTALAWKTPYSKRVDSLTNFQDTYAAGDDLLVKPLVENAASLTDSDIEKARHIALSEPLIVDRIVASDASVAAVNITMHLPQAGSHGQCGGLHTRLDDTNRSEISASENLPYG